MSYRNTGIGRHSQRGCHTRNNLERNVVFQQIFAFLSAAAKQITVTALQTNGLLARLRQTHQDFIDLILRHRMMIVFLSDIDALSGLRNEFQNIRADQSIIYNCLGRLQHLSTAQGEQITAARAGAD